MKLPSKSVSRTRSGFALLITLTFLAVGLVIFSSIMFWISSSARVSAQNNLFNTSQAAAQAATQMAIAQMDRDFLYQSLNDVSVYQVLVLNQTNWPIQYQISDTNGVPNQVSVSITPQNWSTNWGQLNSQFSGLYGAFANCSVTAVATPLNQSYNMSAVVNEAFQLTAIPVFQYGCFYNMDMDFSPGQSLTFNGKVHCNGIIWMCPQAATYFNDVVEATLTVTNHDNPNDQQNLSFIASNLHYNGGNAVSGCDSLTLPISGSSTNVKAILNLPPTGVGAPNSAAYLATNQIYLYNECDLIISNSISGTNNGTTCAAGTNITIYYQDKDQIGGPLIQFTNNELCTFSNRSARTLTTVYSNTPPLPATNYVLIGSGFPFVTNVTYFDFRENDNVQALQIDIAKLITWLNDSGHEGYCWNQACGGLDGVHGHKGHPIDSIYVYNSVPPVTGSPGQLPAVRVVNGALLPSSKGLTIATPFPLYVLGNYNIMTNSSAPLAQQSQLKTNTAWTWPAALMGDSITILSGNWVDTGHAYTNGGSLSSRSTINTTVNAACLEGIVQSTNNGAKHYSGGLENFLRLEENWSSTLCYNGSIVVMFPSAYATSFWQGPGNYYNPPTRQWGFDANFTTQAGLPPCTPQAKGVIRGNWTTW